MKIERVDEKTVKCFLSMEELEAYQLDYKDFLSHTPKAREVVQEIMEQAAIEVGYKPPRFAFDLQIVMMPEKGMLLTFSEKDPLDSKEGRAFLDYLKEVQKSLMEKLEEKHPDEVPKPEKAVFAFACLEDIISLAKALPGGLRVETALYKMDGEYFLMLNKGKASYERYSRICLYAMEYGTVYGTREDMRVYLEEHGECLVGDKALNLLQRC